MARLTFLAFAATTSGLVVSRFVASVRHAPVAAPVAGLCRHARVAGRDVLVAHGPNAAHRGTTDGHGNDDSNMYQSKTQRSAARSSRRNS
jgi:hypothetical protein